MPIGRIIVQSDAASQEVGGGSAFRTLMGNIDRNFKSIEDEEWPPPPVIPPQLPPSEPGLRLSLTPGVAVSAGDVGGAATMYGVLAGTNVAGIWDGTQWFGRTIAAELVLPLSTATNANAPYSVFVFWDAVGGTVKLGHGLAWASQTQPQSDSVTELFQGRLVNQNPITLVNGASSTLVPARQALLLGGFATNGSAGLTDDTALKRLVSNVYHAAPRAMRRIDASLTSWVCPADPSPGTWRYMRDLPTLNRLEFFSINGNHPVHAWATANAGPTSADVFATVGIGLDQTAATPSPYITSLRNPTRCPVFIPTALSPAFFNDYPGIGRHTLNWLATSAAASASEFFFALDSRKQVGIFATVYT
jgi:hypothetical protein